MRSPARAGIRPTRSRFSDHFHRRRNKNRCREISLAQNQFRLRNIQIHPEFGATCSLHAMIRPQDLLAVIDIDEVIWLAAGMRGGEGTVSSRVPVLRENDMRKTTCDAVDRWDDLVTGRTAKAPSGQKSFWILTTRRISLFSGSAMNIRRLRRSDDRSPARANGSLR